MAAIKRVRNKKRIVRGVVLILGMLAITAGCSQSDNVARGDHLSESPSPSASASASPAPSPVATDAKDDDVQRELLVEFEAVARGAEDASDIIEYLDAHIAEADTETADAMLRGLHAYYAARQQDIEDEFYNSVAYVDVMNLGWPLEENTISAITDDEVRRLASLYYYGGYKFSTAEGPAFAIVDYSYQRKYADYLSGQMNDYIALMSMQADKYFARDAGLMISWDELADRTLLAERFLSKYPDAPEREEIMKVYLDQYLFAYLTGLVNTPIYDRDRYTLLEEVKDSYERTIAVAEESVTGQLTKRFMEALASEDGLVYRKSAGEKTKTPAVMQFHESLKAEAERRINQP